MRLVSSILSTGPGPRRRETGPRWSWLLGRFGGIEVHLHGTFFLLLAGFGAVKLVMTRSATATAVSLASIVAVFVCVLLHEYGHALVARRFGIGTRRITLLPIGGIAQLERVPERPREELWIAVAGPAVNLALATVILALLGVGALVQAAFAPYVISALLFLLAVNLLLFAFNLLPAFPMDGGRVLRAVLAMRMNRLRATSIAARLGQTMALGLGVAGFFFSPLLVLIAVFVWFGASQEVNLATARAQLGGASVGTAMATDFQTLAPGDSLRSAADLLVRTAQRHYPVVSEGTVVGVLLQEDLLRSLSSAPDRRVAEVMRPDFIAARPGEPLDSAFARLVGGPLAALPVLDGTRLVGLITREQVLEFLALRRAQGSPSLA